jgi:hypothetical protein
VPTATKSVTIRLWIGPGSHYNDPVTLAEFKRTIRPGDAVMMTENTLVPRLPFIGKRRKVSRITRRCMVLLFEEPGDVYDFHVPLPRPWEFHCHGRTFAFMMRSVTGVFYRITYRWHRKVIPIRQPHQPIS